MENTMRMAAIAGLLLFSSVLLRQFRLRVPQLQQSVGIGRLLVPAPLSPRT
jgi:hypothetical protein